MCQHSVTFITYARPILEYNSPLWSPTLKKDIISIESVQRKFTKRIPGNVRLVVPLKAESIKFRKLRVEEAPCRFVASLQNIVWFGLLRVNSDIFFTPRNQSQLRGHAYMLHKQRCFSSNRRNFFSIWIVSMWNSLPTETTDFSGLDKFNNSVSNMFLLKLNFCQVNFEWISPCDTETFIVRFI